MKYTYNQSDARISELKTRVYFFEYEPSEGPEPGEVNKHILYSCWAKVENVWMKDVERAKENGTLEDITLFIRDARGDYVPDSRHYLSIDALGFKDKRYNIKTIMPDIQNKQFTVIIAGLVT